MSGKTISQLTAKGAVQDAFELEVQDGSTSGKITAAQLRAYANANSPVVISATPPSSPAPGTIWIGDADHPYTWHYRGEAWRSEQIVFLSSSPAAIAATSIIGFSADRNYEIFIDYFSFCGITDGGNIGVDDHWRCLLEGRLTDGSPVNSLTMAVLMSFRAGREIGHTTSGFGFLWRTTPNISMAAFRLEKIGNPSNISPGWLLTMKYRLIRP